jgi:hypothetical protein
MIERPCKPDADVQWLWQTLLPDTPFSACGTANDHSAGIVDEEPDRRAHVRELAGRSWFRTFWPVRSQS